MRTSKLVIFIVLVVMLGLIRPHSARFGFAGSKETELAKPSSAEHSPLDKLDRKVLRPIERTECPEETVAIVPGESSATVSCAFSPDGKFAAGYSNGTIGLWDMTGTAPKQMAVLKAGVKSDRVTYIRFSPNGKRIAAIRGTTLQLWDVTGDGAKLLTSWEVGRAQGLGGVALTKYKCNP
jgi:WD40 repeat protein